MEISLQQVQTGLGANTILFPVVPVFFFCARVNLPESETEHLNTVPSFRIHSPIRHHGMI
jgi:hypothetical protein